MPSGGSVLLALLVLLTAGFGGAWCERLGLTRTACALWAGLALAASGVNLPLPPHGAVLINPGGTVVPLAFAAFVLSRPGPRGRLWWMRLAAAVTACAVGICAVLIWGEEAGVGWPAVAGAAAVAGLFAGGIATEPRDTLAVGCAGLGAAALGWLVAARSLPVAWPPAFGGGHTFTAGVLAVVGGQLLPQLPIWWRSHLRAAAPIRPELR